MVNKKAVVIASIIAIFVVGVLLGINIYKLNNINYEDISESEENTLKNTTSLKTNSVTENKVNENALNTVDENNVIDSNTTNTLEDDTNTTNTLDENTLTNSINANTKTSTKNSEEKAKELVKKKFGNKNSNVYYNAEEVQKGIYIVTIRDEDTTAEVASYEVDVNKETVSEY